MTSATLRDLRGVGEAVERKLNSIGIYNVGQVLDCLPRQYIDLSLSVPLEGAEDGSFCLFDAVITDKTLPRKKGNLSIFTASARCGAQFVKLTWFNHNFVHKTLLEGETYTFFGKLKIRDYQLEFNNPHFEKKTENSRFCGICPIYATKGAMGQAAFSKIAEDALRFVPDSIISSEMEGKLGVMSLKEAYFALHKPTEKNNVAAARRVALEKLTERIAAFKLAKKSAERDKNRRYKSYVNFEKILKNAGFDLTESQKAAVDRIFSLMRGRTRMNAVLCGDVGSGKTVVAVLAAFLAVTSGYQAAIVAPTELLAAQHARFFGKVFEDTGVRCVLLTGATPSAEKKHIRSLASAGEADIVIGTHAVFSDKLVFANLGLAVADEQHRFGVAQRNSLFEKGSYCDVLTLSATPIPRTMCLAAYGEAEFITIERRTKGNIRTSIVPQRKRADMFKYLADRCAFGAKIYLIAPRIADAEGIERETCESLYKETARYIPSEKIGLMHGKMKQNEKDSVMERFRDGEIRVLVATTVVEVGVDVPDATIMVITDADKLGLAALHQLRGRVGRNGDISYCFLLADGEIERLKTLTSSDDGFFIAEEDFNRRGGGEIFGLMQSGKSSLHVDSRLLKQAKIASDGVDTERWGERLSLLSAEFSLNDVTMG